MPNAIAFPVKKYIEDKYNVTVLCMNVDDLDEHKAQEVLRTSLYEFPVSSINLNLVDWVSVLDSKHWLKKSISDGVNKSREEYSLDWTELKCSYCEKCKEEYKC